MGASEKRFQKIQMFAYWVCHITLESKKKKATVQCFSAWWWFEPHSKFMIQMITGNKCEESWTITFLVAWAEPRWCLGIPKNTQLLYQKNTYTSIKHICICYSGLYSLFLKSKRHSHPMWRHPLSQPISKPLPDGPRKQELEPIPAQSLLRFPAMVAARDCGQQLVATLGRLTLPPHWCRAPLYCAGAVGQLGRPQGGPRRHAQLREAKGHRPRTTTRCLLP